MSKIKLSKRDLIEDSQEGKEVNISKATYNDKIRWLHEAVDKIEYHYKDKWGDMCRCYCWLRDHDDDYVYVHIKDATYRMPYTLENNKVDIDTSDPIEVVSETTYTAVGVDESDESDEDSMVEKILKGLTKHFGGTQKDTPLQVIKQLDEDQMIAIEPLYIFPDEVDGHGDSMDEIEIRKMVDSMNKAINEKRLKSSLFHKETTEGFAVVKAWVNEVDCMIGESFVPEGQPIVKTQFTDKKLWEARKTGKLKGVSIGAKAKRVEEREL